MKTPLLTFACALLCGAVSQANQLNEPIDRMPIPGNQIPSLENRIRDLENRLRELEKANGEKKQSEPNPKPSAFLNTALEHADALLKDGDLAGAAKAYQEALDKTIERLNATPQALTDCFLASFSSTRAVDTLEAKGERALAKALCGEILKTLRLCRKTMPEWKPAIIEYRLKKVEERLATLQ